MAKRSITSFWKRHNWFKTVLNFINPKFQEDVMERLGDIAHYLKLDSSVYSAELPLVNAPLTWPRIGGN